MKSGDLAVDGDLETGGSAIVQYQNPTQLVGVRMIETTVQMGEFYRRSMLSRFAACRGKWDLDSLKIRTRRIHLLTVYEQSGNSTSGTTTYFHLFRDHEAGKLANTTSSAHLSSFACRPVAFELPTVASHF